MRTSHSAPIHQKQTNQQKTKKNKQKLFVSLIRQNTCGRRPKTYARAHSPARSGCVKIATRPRYFALIQLSPSLSSLSSLSLSLFLSRSLPPPPPPPPPLNPPAPHPPSLSRSLALPLSPLSFAKGMASQGAPTKQKQNKNCTRRACGITRGRHTAEASIEAAAAASLLISLTHSEKLGP